MAGFFYTHFQAEPCYNMAFDEWMLGRSLSRPGSIFLRLYSWSTGTITIGVNQNQATAYDHARLGSTPVIRRITGGRALYHDPGELTYSIAANIVGNDTGRLSGSVLQTSTVIAESLVEFLARLGVAAAYVRRSSAANASPAFFHTAPCFASLAKYELIGNTGKIVASAQRRVGESAFLQHGSIKLHGVVSHPALNPDTAANTVEGVLTEGQFAHAAETFRTAMAGQLGVSLDCASPVGEDATLSEFLNTVQKNPLARRDSVKQRFSASSL